MGVVNVTPDSFSDGGELVRPQLAARHARKLVAAGADIVDVGGESTRPGAEPVTADEELRRVAGVLEELDGLAAEISIDTSKACVAEAAIDAGATLVNDVTGLRADPDLAPLVAQRDVECCLVHMQGDPRTMQRDPRYADVVSEVKSFLEERLRFATAEGIREERILVDPGLGFGKTVQHNVTLLRRLHEIAALGRPVVIGASRKRFLGDLTGRSDPRERLAASVTANVIAMGRGARVFRVHDVGATRDALLVASALWSHPGDPVTHPSSVAASV